VRSALILSLFLFDGWMDGCVVDLCAERMTRLVAATVQSLCVKCAKMDGAEENGGGRGV